LLLRPEYFGKQTFASTCSSNRLSSHLAIWSIKP
jgi:hypothetical protein